MTIPRALLCLVLFLATNAVAGKNWVYQGRHGDIDLWGRLDGNVYSTKGKMVLKKTDPMAIAAVINDYEAMTYWIKYLNSVQEISRKNETDRLLYATINLPIIPVRDGVIHAYMVKKNNVFKVVLENVKSSFSPNNKSFRRMSYFHGVIQFTAVNFKLDEIEVVYTMEISIEEKLPPGAELIVTPVMKAASYETLVALENRVKLKSYAGKKFSYIDLKFSQ